jgi:cobalt-zinc-cadmium efflux system protein
MAGSGEMSSSQNSDQSIQSAQSSQADHPDKCGHSHDGDRHGHHQGHSHSRSHSHSHGRLGDCHGWLRSLGNDNAQSIANLKRVLFFTFLFMIVEAVGGYYTQSLALLSDAAHMLTDAAAIGLSLFAFFMSSLPATSSRTYGYYRMEILAAFINGIFLVLIALAIMYSAWTRYHQPVSIKTMETLAISTAGLIFNLFGAWLLTRGGGHSHPTMRSALFHVIGDALGSLGAMVAAVLAHYGWMQADPIASFVIALIIVVSAGRLILDTAHVILEGVPHHLDTRVIHEALAKEAHVREVHDLHVWSITAGMVSLSVHIVANACDRHQLLCRLRDLLREQFHIEHVTIQIEDESLKGHEPPI